MPAACRPRTIVLNSRTVSSGVRDDRVARIGREEAERVVAPVVRQALFEQVLLVDVDVDGQQLHRRDAERLEMIERRLAHQAEIRAAQILGDAGMTPREATDVQLVDDRVLPRRPRADDRRPRRTRRRPRRRAAPTPRCPIVALSGLAEAESEERIVPPHPAADRPRIGVDHELGRVETMPERRRPRPMDRGSA